MNETSGMMGMRTARELEMEPGRAVGTDTSDT